VTRGRPTYKLTGAQIVLVRKLFRQGYSRKEIHAHPQLRHVSYVWITILLKRFGVRKYSRSFS